ncbi:ATP binding [Microbotryomycetes sp. JL201]|nr:ATP binding [Microbotryomycetes sp. JL201]
MSAPPIMGNGSRPGSALGQRVQASVPDDPETHTRPYQDFVKTWDDERVGHWLAQIGAGQHQDTFQRNDIRGHVLLDVDQAALKEMGVRSVGDRVKITVAIKALRNKCTSSAASLRAMSSRSASPAPTAQNASTSSGATLAKRPSGRIPPPLHLSRSNSTATAESSNGSVSTYRSHQSSHSLSSATFSSSATTPTSATTPRLVASASSSPATRGQPQSAHSTSPPRTTMSSLKSAPHILTTAASPTNSYTGTISGTSLNQLRNKSASPSPGERLRSPPGSQLPPRSATSSSSALAHRKSPSLAAGARALSGTLSETLVAHPYAAASSPTQDAFTVTSYGRASPGSSPASSTPLTLQSRLLPSPSIPNTATLSPSSSAQSLDDVLRKTSKFVGQDGVTKLIAVADCKDGREVLARVVKKFSTSTSEDDLEQWGVFTIGSDGNVGRLLNEAELYAICRDSASADRQRGLAVRRLPQDKRGRKLQWVFGESGAPIDNTRIAASAGASSPASPNYLGIEIPTTFVEPASPSSSSHSGELPPTVVNSERVKRNRASVVSVMSGLGGADWSSENLSTQFLRGGSGDGADRDSFYGQRNRNSSASLVNNPNSSSGRKLRNFFGQRPPSELIATHLLEYFPKAERSKLLSKQVRQSLRKSMLRRDSQSSGLAGQTSWDKSVDGPNGRTSDERARPTTAGSKSSAPPSILESMFEDDHGEGLDELAPAEDTRSLASSRVTRHSSSKRKSGASRLSLWDKRSRDSDVASIVTVDEVTAELENRRSSWIAAGVEGSSEDEDAAYRSSSDLSAESVFLGDDDDGEEESDDTDESEQEHDQDRGAGQGKFRSFATMNTSSGSLMAVKQVELPTGNSHNEEKKKAMLEALQREIELLKTLQHENIVQYLDSASDGQHLNIFLEYVPGGSVAALLSNYGAFEEALVSKFVRQILTGLEYLHEREIIHRDIKGANILVDNKGGIKISDFGISKKVEDNLLSGSKVHRPSLQGSVYWMAPEVVKQTAYTSKADIWSLGCLVVEMLTGTHPWANLTQMQAIFRIGQSAVPAIPDDISTEAEHFLDETFSIDHDARPSATNLLKHAFVSSFVADGDAVGSASTSTTTTNSITAVTDVSQQTPTRATFAAAST